MKRIHGIWTGTLWILTTVYLPNVLKKNYSRMTIHAKKGQYHGHGLY